jgi:hypothetical protein
LQFPFGAIGKQESKGDVAIEDFQGDLGSASPAIIAGGAAEVILQRMDAVKASADGLFIYIAGTGRFVGNDGHGQRIVRR